MPLIEVIRVVEKIAADPKFCSPTWRTDLAYKEEAGLAPMFRSMLRSNHFHELRAFVSMDYTEGGTIPELPRIKTGRCAPPPSQPPWSVSCLMPTLCQSKPAGAVWSPDISREYAGKPAGGAEPRRTHNMA